MLKKAAKTSIKWVCGKQKGKKIRGGLEGVSLCKGFFFSASNIGFRQEESAVGLGGFALFRALFLYPKISVFPFCLIPFPPFPGDLIEQGRDLLFWGISLYFLV